MADGLYQGQEVFLGMVEAMVKKTERLAAGKALSNMEYSGAFNQVCNILGSVSPRLYRTFRTHFGGPSIRNMRYVTYSTILLPIYLHLLVSGKPEPSHPSLKQALMHTILP